MFAVRRAAVPLFVLGLLVAEAAPASGEEIDLVPPDDATPPAGGAGAAAANAPSTPKAPSGAPVTVTLDGKTVSCREQTPLSFLVRGNWFPKTKDADKVKEGRKLLEDAIRFRTEKYGYFEGFGNPKSNAHPPKFYAKTTSFMGMPVQVNERIIPALKCVEAALKGSPAGDEYHPKSIGGIRFKNTYRGFEVSNHVYGIAVDIEPDRNTCCGCVAPWPDHPLCKAKNKTVWERMAMPKSWVETFERFGFYWLGHDVLQDTMHFEFLADPDKIVDPT